MIDAVREPARDRSEFRKELEDLINRYSMENGSNTPDHILAGYLDGCLRVYEQTIQQRESWFGKEMTIVPVKQGAVKVPVLIYDDHGRKNELGEAQLNLWPGEKRPVGMITGVVLVVDTNPMNIHH